MVNCREYGDFPYKAIVVHGGPGAPGSCASLCKGLSDKFGILEHLQEGYSIDELAEELYSLVSRYSLEKVVLIGHSWGVWLSFMFAAKYPQFVSKLILVGSGLFDANYYPQLLEARSIKVRPEKQKEDIMTANLYSPDAEYNPDNYCLIKNPPNDMIAFNEKQYNALMNEIIPMRESGELLNFASRIKCPVIIIHGKNDPHPVGGIKVPLESRIQNIKTYILEKCGHDPWLEYYAKDRFFEILTEEMNAG